jgi:NTP pyrophosphatase (non-canonical NTP hydrolase)
MNKEDKTVFDDDILKKVIQHYGHDYMMVVAMEEASELVQAISKIYRYGVTLEAVNHLNEEIADVLIVIEELKKMGFAYEPSIKEWIDSKQKRSMERIRK